MVWYEETKETTSDKNVKLNFIANAKAMNALLSGLCDCEIAKDIYVKLENIHEGYKKVKMTKKVQVVVHSTWESLWLHG